MEECNRLFLDEVHDFLTSKCMEFGADGFVFTVTKGDQTLHLYAGGRVNAIGLLRLTEQICIKEAVDEVTD